MHALFVTAHIDAGRNEEEGLKYLEMDVLPQLKKFPGVVGGYWLATKDSESLAVVLFDTEKAATQMKEVGLPQAPPTPGATLGAIEVREVIAHI
ncbi:MAG: hypothetical protein QOG04_582 [Actinomycetota bacterium]|jgi:hypothetical protein|nr:hypothetical protein [Actinomycetota bacterium]